MLTSKGGWTNCAAPITCPIINRFFDSSSNQVKTNHLINKCRSICHLSVIDRHAKQSKPTKPKTNILSRTKSVDSIRAEWFILRLFLWARRRCCLFFYSWFDLLLRCRGIDPIRYREVYSKMNTTRWFVME